MWGEYFINLLAGCGFIPPQNCAGHDPLTVAFIVGLFFLFAMFFSFIYLVARLGNQTITGPIALFILGLGVAVDTYFGWWPSWILIAMVFISIFAIIFFPGGFGTNMGANVGQAIHGAAHSVEEGAGRRSEAKATRQYFKAERAYRISDAEAREARGTYTKSLETKLERAELKAAQMKMLKAREREEKLEKGTIQGKLVGIVRSGGRGGPLAVVKMDKDKPKTMTKREMREIAEELDRQ